MKLNITATSANVDKRGKNDFEVAVTIDKSEVKDIISQIGYENIAGSIDRQAFLEEYDVEELAQYLRDYGYSIEEEREFEDESFGYFD